jgi:hypothetical protein
MFECIYCLINEVGNHRVFRNIQFFCKVTNPKSAVQYHKMVILTKIKKAVQLLPYVCSTGHPCTVVFSVSYKLL